MRALDWPVVRLGSLLTDIQPGFASGRHNSSGEGVPHFRPMNVSTDGRIDRAVLKYVDPDAGRKELRLQRGDVIFNNTNSPELVGKTALFEDEDAPAFSNHMTRLRVDSSRLHAGYLALRLHQAWREGWFAAHCNNHVSQASISRDILASFEFELPPLEVQREIAHLSRAVEDCRISSLAHLGTARKIIERFRDSVFAAASSGRLTQDFRESQSKHETVTELLEAIRVASRNSQRPIDPEIIEAPDGSDTPSTWTWVTFGSVISELRNGVSVAPAMEPPGIPILRISAVRRGSADLTDLRFLRDDIQEWASFALRDGDLLFTRYNGSISLLGVCGLVRNLQGRTIVYPDKLMRIRFDHEFILPEYVEIFFASPAARSRMTARSVSSAGQQGISGATVKAQALAIPPLEEQREIARRATGLLRAAQLVECQLVETSSHLDETPRAFHAKAFRGELIGDPA